jgi:hypothetical protein
LETPNRRLLRFFVGGMLFTEFAVFAHFYPVRVILFVLIGLVIALLAFGAGQSNSHSHKVHLAEKNKNFRRPLI